MATYRKDKNNFIITLDNSNGSYRLDINTGVFYGIKGNPIKTAPRRRDILKVLPYYTHETADKPNCNLARIIYRMISNSATTASYATYVDIMQSADKVDSIGCPCLYLRGEQYIYLGKHIKTLSDYMKTLEEDKTFCYADFREYCEWELVKKSLGSVAEQLTAGQYMRLKDRMPSITHREIDVCNYYLNRGKLWDYHLGEVNNLIEYLSMCRGMNKTAEKTNNFMREYCETKATYELKKAEYDTNRLTNNYKAREKAWEFEYGDFTIVIPKEAKDIITEGQKMHHCVGGYVNYVMDGSTYICFVRRKDNPDTPYITCQVTPKGEIGQYFLAYDRHISTAEDKAFKSAFQAHLDAVWND